MSTNDSPNIIKLIVTETDQLDRLDKFLGSRDDLSLSRNKVEKLIESKLITVNDSHPTKKQQVHVGDKIEISLIKAAPTQLVAEDIPLDIIFEDDHLIVVNKPAGMVTHPGVSNYSGTLANALTFHFQKLSTLSGDDRPGIVHRLDKDTSGLLLIAKNDEIHNKLQRAIQSKDVKRTYTALVFGHMPKPTDIIDLPLGRSMKNPRLRVVTKVNSREAQTEYKVLERFRVFDSLELNLLTGRTHQIRVHLSHLGHPVFGDPDYGGRERILKGIFGPERPFVKQLLDVLSRQALHAKALSFKHPVTDEEMEFTVELPSDFKKVLNALQEQGG